MTGAASRRGAVAAGDSYVRRMRREVAALDARIAKADQTTREARTEATLARARAFALEERCRKIRWLATAHLPPSAEGIPLVHRLDRFLAERGDELGPAALDALAACLDPDRRR